MKLHLISDEGIGDRPKLGLGYIASYIHANSDDIKISLSHSTDDIIENIKRIKPDVIGLTANSLSFQWTNELACKIKQNFDIPLILGGPHITIVPASLPASIDIGVLGEGEQTMLELIELIQKEGVFDKESLKNIDGLVFREKDKLYFTKKRRLIEPLDVIPFPDRDLLKVQQGSGKHWRQTHIMTSRGCPYKCRFCSSSSMWEKTRLFSANYVVEEIKLLIEKYRIQQILIYDDLFIVNKKRALAISKLIRKEGLHKKADFGCLSRADIFDEDIAKALKNMNVTWISFGMESGSQEILSFLKNDAITLDMIRKAVALAKKIGIPAVDGSFMVGSPHETREDALKTVAFIRELGLSTIGYNITTPFPGTELWKYALDIGCIPEDAEWNEKFYLMKSVTAENLKEKINLSDMNPEVMYKMYVMIEKLNKNLMFRHKIKVIFSRYLLEYIIKCCKNPVFLNKLKIIFD